MHAGWEAQGWLMRSLWTPKKLWIHWVGFKVFRPAICHTESILSVGFPTKLLQGVMITIGTCRDWTDPLAKYTLWETHIALEHGHLEIVDVPIQQC